MQGAFLSRALSITNVIFQEPNTINLLHLFVNIAGKLYVYMLLWTLNYRDELRVRMKSHDLGRVSLGNWQWEQSGSSEDPATVSCILGLYLTLFSVILRLWIDQCPSQVAHRVAECLN